MPSRFRAASPSVQAFRRPPAPLLPCSTSCVRRIRSLSNTIGFGSLLVEIAPAAVTDIAANGRFVLETATTNLTDPAKAFELLYIGRYVIPTDTFGSPPQSLFTNVVPQGGPLPQVGESLVDGGRAGDR